MALRARGLYAATVDGVRGPMTSEGVRRFQARRGLVVDGIAGPRTRAALGWRGRPRLGSRAIAAGARGWDVAALQWLLATRGFASGPFDGRLGARGDTALRRFQAWAGLGADGVAGPATLAAVRRAPARSPLQFLAPLGGAPTDRFGPRGNSMHTGIDYPAAAGTGVAAAGRGCVQSAGYDGGGYGNLVVIEHRAGDDQLVRAPRHDRRSAPASAWSRATRSAPSGRPATRPARTCISSSASTARRSIL